MRLITWSPVSLLLLAQLIVAPGRACQSQPQSRAAALRKRALLVGVDRYQCPDIPPLRGAASDARRLAHLLQAGFGFQECVVLTAAEDRQAGERPATRAGVLAAMDRFGQETRPGDVAVFFFSGHGTLVPDQPEGDPDHDEPFPGMDSALVMTDSPSMTTGMLRDDELHHWLAGLAGRGAHVIALFDACHSGGAWRGGDYTTRGLAVDSHRVRPTTAPAASGPAAASLAAGTAPFMPAPAVVVALGACRDHELAQEGPDPDEGGYSGVFSRSLRRTLRTSRPGETWLSLFDRLVAALRAGGHPQQPTLAGHVDSQGRQRIVFGSGAVRAPSVPQVVSVADSGVQIAAGFLHGVRKDALFRLYSADVTLAQVVASPDLLPRATVKVSRVLADACEGVWVERPAKEPVGPLGLALCAAVPEARPSVGVRVAPGVGKDLLEAIQEKLDRDAGGPVHAGFFGSEPSVPRGPGGAAPVAVATLVPGGPRGVQLLTGNGLRADFDPRDPGELAQALRRVLHAQGLLGLRAPEPNVLSERLELLVRVDTSRRGERLTPEQFLELPTDLPRGPKGLVTLRASQDKARCPEISLAIAGRYKGLDRNERLYAYVFDITADHKVQLFGARTGDAERSIDPNGLTVIDQVRITPPAGPECLMVIVSRRPLPGIQCLAQEAVFRGSDRKDALTALIEQCSKPYQTRSEPLGESSPVDWTVFHVHWDVVVE